MDNTFTLGPPRPTLRALLVLALLTCAYLWEPISSGGIYAPTDYLQGSELLRIAPAGYVRRNPLMGDVVDQMHPALMWNRTEIWQGRLPTWNPYNGWGAPHLANYQSAVFSLFSLPFYILPFRLALVVAAGLKLYSLGLFTFFFLRILKLSHVAALAGAVAYMFSGYNLLWLSWDHAPTAVTLPIGMYCVEQAFQRHAGQRTSRWLWMVALACGLAVGLLAGHPETFFYCAILLAAYTLFRLILLSEPVGERLRRVVELILAASCAVGLAAVQLLPFVEYLRVSTVYRVRATADHVITLYTNLIGLLIFPDLLGNPARSYSDPALASLTNYNEANGHYTGVIVLFLAGMALLVHARQHRPLVVFLSVVCVVWLLYAYNIAGLAERISDLPIFSIGVVTRSQPIWLFSLSCLMALGMDGLRQAPAANRRWIAFGGLVWAIGLALFAGVSAQQTLVWAAGVAHTTVATEPAHTFVRQHVSFIALTAAIALIATALVLFARQLVWRWLAIGAQLSLILLIFVQSGLLLRSYNPTIDAQYFYPATARLREIISHTGSAQTLRLDGAILPANSNLWYQLRSPSSYDAIGVAHYDWLHEQLLRSSPVYETANPASLRALQLMGVQYLLTSRPIPFATASGGSGGARVAPTITDPLIAGFAISQTFRSEAAGLSALVVPFALIGPSPSCTVIFTLEDLEAARVVDRQSLSCAALLPSVAYPYRFAPQPESAGRQYRLTITSPDATPSNTVAPYYAAPADTEQLLVGGKNLPGELIFDSYTAALSGLDWIWTSGNLVLYRVPGSLPQYFSVGRAELAISDAEGVQRLQMPGFDPATTVLIQDAPAPPAGDSTPGKVRLITATPTTIHLLVERGTPGWLVALQTYYPGWSARVNGQVVPIVRANLAFSAVALGAGTSDVVLSYTPLSVTLGMSISLLVGIGLLVVVAMLARKRHRLRQVAASVLHYREIGCVN